MITAISTTHDELEDVYKRIAPYIHRTPILTSQSLNKIAGCELFFKCENFQKIGAFKARGAANAILNLGDEQQKKGVATHSSGNHGQAVAYVAHQLGIPAYIVMPENAPLVKKNAVLGYGALVTECRPTLQAREEMLEAVTAETQANFIPPYDHRDIILGQSSASKEVFDELNELDYLITPVGGGGLLSGAAIAREFFSPNTHIIGAEPERADDAYQSFKSGQHILPENPDTVADGLRTALGKLNFEVIKEGVDDILLASEQEILDAQLLIMQRMKIVVEPSSAVPLAVVLKNRDVFEAKRVAIIVSGGNVDRV